MAVTVTAAAFVLAEDPKGTLDQIGITPVCEKDAGMRKGGGSLIL